MRRYCLYIKNSCPNREMNKKFKESPSFLWRLTMFLGLHHISSGADWLVMSHTRQKASITPPFIGLTLLHSMERVVEASPSHCHRSHYKTRVRFACRCRPHKPAASVLGLSLVFSKGPKWKPEVLLLVQRRPHHTLFPKIGIRKPVSGEIRIYERIS